MAKAYNYYSCHSYQSNSHLDKPLLLNILENLPDNLLNSV